MGWKRLTPLVLKRGPRTVKVGIYVDRSGLRKAQLTVTDALHKMLGEPRRLDVSLGEGEHENHLLLEFGDGGAFELTRFKHGGGRVFFPPPPIAPPKATAAVACGYEIHGDTLVLKLPVDAWAQPSPRRAQSPPPAPPPTRPLNGEKFDMVEFLAGRGVKISRFANNRFAVDGETLQDSQVLRMVNSRRLEADLDPLPPHKVY